VRHGDGRTDCAELRPSENSGCVVWTDEARSSCLFQRRGLKATPKTLSEAGQVLWGGTPHLQGSRSQCVLEGGIVRCTGDNVVGGLGDPSLKRAERPVAVPGMTNVVSLSDSSTSTCAVRADGSAWCWGRNAYGEIAVAPDPRPCVDGRAKVTCNRAPTRLPVNDVAQVVFGAQMYVLTHAGALLISRLDGPSP
jgi:alpha-tubulin suppressor-like RCC1 family protein